MLKAKTYPILLQAVEEGILLSLNRTWDIQDESVKAGIMTDTVMETILEWFDIQQDTVI